MNNCRMVPMLTSRTRDIKIRSGTIPKNELPRPKGRGIKDSPLSGSLKLANFPPEGASTVGTSSCVHFLPPLGEGCPERDRKGAFTAFHWQLRLDPDASIGEFFRLKNAIQAILENTCRFPTLSQKIIIEMRLKRTHNLFQRNLSVFTWRNYKA